MIASEKQHQNLLDYNKSLFKNEFEVNKKQIFTSKNMINSCNCIYDHAPSFFGDDFQINALYWSISYLVVNLFLYYIEIIKLLSIFADIRIYTLAH